MAAAKTPLKNFYESSIRVGVAETCIASLARANIDFSMFCFTRACSALCLSFSVRGALREALGAEEAEAAALAAAFFFIFGSRHWKFVLSLERLDLGVLDSDGTWTRRSIELRI